MYVAAAGDLSNVLDTMERTYTRLYKEAGFAFVNHSASKSQGWVVQNEYDIAEYVSIARLVVVHCICTNLYLFQSTPPCV